jgi:hypothetical protein
VLDALRDHVPGPGPDRALTPEIAAADDRHISVYVSDQRRCGLRIAFGRECFTQPPAPLTAREGESVGGWIAHGAIVPGDGRC